MRTLRLALLAQLAFFAIWGGLLLSSHRVAETVWLETSPFDPRDLLAGHYVALAYPLENEARDLCSDARTKDAERVYVRLEHGGGAYTDQGFVPLSRPVACQSARPAEGSGVWIEGHRRPPDSRIRFGLERFYVPEDSPLRHVRSGDVVAEVAINPSWEPRLLALRASVSPTDSPPPTAEPSESTLQRTDPRTGRTP